MTSILGLHEKALLIRENRAEILASNLANIDTPNYKARDLDFAEILQAEQGESAPDLTTTSNLHFHSQNVQTASQVKYRIPAQVSTDGNTVDAQIEQAKFTENAMQYMASLNFITNKVNNLLAVIKGD